MERDQNGNFLIDNRRRFSGDVETTSEYVEVDFRLEPPADPIDGKVYVTGGFSNYSVSPKFELQYDSVENLYIGTVLMKQGRYDLLYDVAYYRDSQLVCLALVGHLHT